MQKGARAWLQLAAMTLTHTLTHVDRMQISSIYFYFRFSVLSMGRNFSKGHERFRQFINVSFLC